VTIARGADKGGLTLLVQLFGRDVLDRLARDGFDSAATIAVASPDHLAATTGIPLGLAERIVTVARETDGAEPGSVKGRAPGQERPRRRPAPKKPAAAAEEPPVSAEAVEGDPIVDDVALVSWMGFSANASGGRRRFSVSDSILDPARPAMLPDISRTVTAEPARAPESTPKKTAPPDPRPPSITLPGSFWSFGRAAEASRPRDADRTVTPSPANVPPRRDHHDH